MCTFTAHFASESFCSQDSIVSMNAFQKFWPIEKSERDTLMNFSSLSLDTDNQGNSSLLYHNWTQVTWKWLLR